jgi:hypothetical protein
VGATWEKYRNRDGADSGPPGTGRYRIGKILAISNLKMARKENNGTRWLERTKK